ncbi:19085_t:CDS:2, partial [Gigaspora margarita]
ANKKQSKEAYTYLNPNLHLPDHRTLARKTLNTVSDNIASYVINQAKTIDVSGHHERTEKIIEYTKKIFNDIKKEQIVVIALVTD